MTTTPPPTGHIPQAPTSTFQLSRSLETLHDRAEAWVEVPLSARIEYLRVLLQRTGEVGSALVEAAATAKGVDRRFVGEDWIGGTAIQARSLRVLIDTLEGIERTGRVAIPADDISTRPDGQVVIRVTPMDLWDRALFPGLRGEIWLDPGVGLDDVDANLGSFYTKPETAVAGVVAVMGAGNVASIAPLDAVHKMFVEGKTVIVKFNPVNDYIGAFFEYVFADLIDDGFVRTAYGGTEVGSYLVNHPLVDEVHITGSARSHDTIVFGPGEDGAARKARGEPMLTKRITSELGCVSPVIVVPGEWKERDLRSQAEHVVTQMKQNDGFNCNAAKVIVLHRDWAQKHEFLNHLRTVLGGLPSRPAYYPGAVERWGRFVESHPDVEMFGAAGDGIVPAALLLGVDPDTDHLAFTEEAFCSVSATTELPGDDAADFLARAVAFCNEKVMGTLNISILIDPGTLGALSDAVDTAVADLEYGAIGVNIWGGASYALGTTLWGGYPGATLEDIQSGIGFVHNGRLIDRPQKTVLWAPFRPFPKPPWFITHRSTNKAMRYFAEFEADPSVLRLMRVGLAALRG